MPAVLRTSAGAIDVTNSYDRRVVCAYALARREAKKPEQPHACGATARSLEVGLDVQARKGPTTRSFHT